MRRKKRIEAKLILGFAMIILLICPPFVSAASTPQGTLSIAWDSLREEAFLPWIGTAGQCDWWEIIYEYPFYLNLKTQEFIPGLALRYEYSKDYKTLTMWLRKGVQWHEGWGEVTAHDVKFSYEKIFEKGSSNAKRSEFGRAIKRMEVLDPYTLVIHFKRAEPLFYMNLCIQDNPYTPILCKKYVEKVGEEEASKHPIGSGPYRLSEHKLGDHFKFEAYEKHWRMVPEFKYIIWRAVPEQSTRAAFLKTGVIDVGMFTTDKVPELQKAKHSIRVSPGTYAVFLNFGGTMISGDKRYKQDYHWKDPWADKKVREAMNIAIDHEAIAKTIYHGLIKASPIHVPIIDWNDLPSIPYDPDKAKRLLAEAGYPKGFSFTMTSNKMSPGMEMPRVVEAVASYWSKVGLKPRIVQGTYSGFRPKFASGETSGMIWVMRTRLGRELSKQMLMFNYPNGSISWYQSQELKALLDKLQKEFEPEKRNVVWREIAKYCRSEWVSVPIAYAPTVYACSAKVGDWPVNPFSSSPNYMSFIRHAEPLNTYRLFDIK